MGTRIYGLCLGLLLIIGAVAATGYLGLDGQGRALLQYIRVSKATANAINVGWEFTRRHMAIFVETAAEDEIKFFADHNKSALDAVAAADARIVVADRKAMVQDIADQYRRFVRATDDIVALRKELSEAADALAAAYAGSEPCRRGSRRRRQLADLHGRAAIPRFATCHFGISRRGPRL